MPTNPKPTASKKSATARANGAKSHGPATAAGRARSSQNARRHGLATGAAGSVVLPTESLEDFHALLNSYLAEFAPVGPVENELVEAMAAARWRLNRIATIETTFLGNEIDRLAPYADKSFAAMHRVPTSDDRLAHAFNTLGNGASLNLLIRYEGTLSRSYARAFKQFQLLRSLRVRSQPNEPKKSLETVPVEPIGDRVKPPAPAPVPVLQTPPQPHKIHLELHQISAPSVPTCDNGGSPRINDQHLHS
jgi:hypothetical protein